MDTIKRLGENETVRRISNGTLKSYVDREIDTVDTSAFINLETLNVPKAESVTIGEGVKDTLEVLNAPKAESIMTYDEVSEGNVEGLGNLTSLKVADVHSADVDVPMFKGCTSLEKATVGGTKGVEPLVVNWGKCGGNTDVIVTYQKDDPLWIPKAFLSQAFNSTYTALQSDNFSDHSVGYKGKKHQICVYKLPQFLGKYLYENAEDCKEHYCYYKDFFNARIYKGIAVYSDTLKSGESWRQSNEWIVGIRTKEDIRAYQWNTNGTLDKDSSVTLSDLEDGVYYLVAENQNFTANQDSQLWEQLSDLYNVEDDDSGTDHIYLRHCADMLAQPNGSTNMGEKYTVTSELLSYPTLDSSYFEGCTNLSEVTITNPELRFNNAIPKTVDLYADETKVPIEEAQPLVVNWGKGGGEDDVVVTYNMGDELYVPTEFFDSYSSTAPTVAPEVGYVGKFQISYLGGIEVYKLPQNLGKWLYENAEDSNNKRQGSDYNFSGGFTFTNSGEPRNYKGFAMYPDTLTTGASWVKSWNWGVGIRIKSDINIDGYTTGGTKHIVNTITSSQDVYTLLDDSSYYMVVESTASDSPSLWMNQWGIATTHEKLYLRHYNTMTKPPHWTNTSSWTSSKDDPSNMGAKYIVPAELCRPQKNVYYSKTKTNADGTPLQITMAEYLQANNSGYSVKGAEYIPIQLPIGGRIFYIDPNDNGATYTFYDENFIKINGTTVSDLSNARYYSVKGNPSKDKFYCYYPTKFDSLQWGYNGTLIGTGTEVGTGKTNTAKVMSRTDIPARTIWSKLSEIRASSGIDDWFVPSKDEIDKFREADLEAWSRSSGGSYLKSSSEVSASTTWVWVFSDQDWDDFGKLGYNSVFFVRAF